MDIYDLISRAQKLRQETKIDSVSPDRVGALCEDTLKYINEFQLLAPLPLLHKIYASVSAMQADKSPKSDLTGKALKPGQLAVIVPASQSDATAGDVYRYDGPSGNTSAWTFVSKILGVPADAELNATSANPVQNKVVTEKLTELAETINEVEEAKADLINEGEKRIVVADGMVDNNDIYYYLPEFAPEGDDEHTFAMKADLKGVDTSALEKVVAAALTDLDTRVQELDAKIINSINAEY